MVQHDGGVIPLEPNSDPIDFSTSFSRRIWPEPDFQDFSPPHCSYQQSVLPKIQDERMNRPTSSTTVMQFGRMSYGGSLVAAPSRMTLSPQFSDSYPDEVVPLNMIYRQPSCTRLQMLDMPPAHSSQPTVTFQPGMKDVPAWLKGLRLHKYTAMFQGMGYDEMLGLTEAQLERRNVTQGARRKILQSIQKLKNRAQVIREIMKGLSVVPHPSLPSSVHQPCGCLRCAIVNLRQLLSTPIRPYRPRQDESTERVEGTSHVHLISNENIPALLMRLLCQVNALVFPVRNSDDVEDEYLLMLFTVYDKVTNNEAFTENQRRRAIQLKKHARKYISPQELRRQRVGVPHTGKCDSCQNKDGSALPPWMSVFHQQQRELSKLPPAVLSQLQEYALTQAMIAQAQMQQPKTQPPPSAPMFWQSPPPPLPQQRIVQQPQADIRRPWSNSCAQEARKVERMGHAAQMSRPLAPRSAAAPKPFSQFPQYQSRQQQHTSSMVLPAQEMAAKEQRWASAIYNSSDLPEMSAPIKTSTLQQSQMNDISNLWSVSTATGGELADSTSGYCSSASERSSGAGSPRARPAAADYDFSQLFENFVKLNPFEP